MRDKKKQIQKDYLKNLLLENFSEKEIIEEHKFHPRRRWRFDFCIPEHKIAIEYEGIFFNPIQGISRHQHGIGYSKDCDKYNAAMVEGWKVFRVTQLHFKEDKNKKSGIKYIDDLIAEIKDLCQPAVL